jgi:prophage regulatory protein
VAKKLIDRQGLRDKGIRFSRQHIDRLEKHDPPKFPRHVDVGENTVAWVEEEIDAWVDAKIARRDTHDTRDT